jgi:hypothetical protein
MARFRRSQGPVYRWEHETIDVSSISPRRDPNWRYTDRAGHEHDVRGELLVRVQDDPGDPPFIFDSDGEEYNAPDHLECRLCGEHITPDIVGPSPFQECIMGPVHYYRDDVEISEDEFHAATGEPGGNAGWDYERTD